MPRRRDLTWLAVGLVGGVLAQIVLGGITVLVDLNPIAVQGHMLVSLALVATAVTLVQRAGEPDDGDAGASRVTGDLPACGRGAVLTAIALVTGTVVTGAGPHAGDEDAKRFDIAIETAARIHGIAVLTAIAAMVVLALRLRRRPAERAELAEWVSAWIFVALLQGTIGYIQYFSDVPAAARGHPRGRRDDPVGHHGRPRPAHAPDAPPGGRAAGAAPGGRRRRADLIATARTGPRPAVGPGAHRQPVRYSLSTQSGAIRPQQMRGRTTTCNDQAYGVWAH